MKVKMLTCRTGPDGVDLPGDIVDMPADEAQRYVESEQAELVDGPKRTAKAPANKPAQRAEKRGSGSAAE